MSLKITLPKSDGSLEVYQVGEVAPFVSSMMPIKCRTAYAAAHVVANPFAHFNPLSEVSLDWESTLQYRHYLWSLGLAVAEAMDTAQRGMGLDWTNAQELIKRSVEEAKAVNGTIACGAGTDQLIPNENTKIDDVINAYEEQVSLVEKVGGRVILMASRALAKTAKSPDDYIRVYGKILSQVEQPVILHWLGEMFDPQLVNYWGVSDRDEAMNICLQLIHEYQTKIDGIKISLLDAGKEIEMRRRLPENVKMYSGDDFNYDQLILGDERGFSHALLGIFDPIAPAASAALRALENGDFENYQSILAPTVPLSRHIFQKPTFAYKTGIVFLAYLNGHQNHFKMVGGQESARSTVHLTELFKLADKANLFINPESAVQRMKNFLLLAGVTNA